MCLGSSDNGQFFSAMSVPNLFSSHLVGEYCKSESHLSALMVPQTMTVISGLH